MVRAEWKNAFDVLRRVLAGRRGIVIAVGVSLVLGFLLHAALTPPAEEAPARAQAGQATEYTCSMHPQIRSPKPGKCPICGMDLILVKKGENSAPREFVVSEAAKALMDIETVPVERKFVTAEVRMVGKVDYDETRLRYITAWMPGRLDRLFVDYTGVPIRKGDHLVSIYSPELLSAQEELIQAQQAVRALKNSDSSLVSQTTEQTLQAAREKLRLLGLTEPQIARLEAGGKPSDHLTIYSPVSGIVVQKNAKEGMYVNTGTRIYTIADLSQVWVRLDAYESDLDWLRYGQKVDFTTAAYPGKIFHGRISFIDPILDSMTRTVKLRVNAPNPDGRLKPGMFVKAVVRSQVAVGGKVMDPDLAGKWICPMHPGIVKDHSGTCDICGMPLARAETLGYVSAKPTEADKPLVIPATAPLVTGTRAVVYVEKPSQNKPTFDGRVIELGPRAGDYYLVLGGLKEGERVVTRGNFKIDSALQIEARPSMMSPEGGVPVNGHQHGGPASPHVPSVPPPGAMRPISPEFHRQLGKLYTGYAVMQQALANDDAAKALQAVQDSLLELDAIDGKLLPEAHQASWKELATGGKKILSEARDAKDIEALRRSFALYSEQMLVVAEHFGPPEGKAFFEIKCPMAFNNRGAIWLQTDRKVRNPYFGQAMPACGEIVKTFDAQSAK